MNSIYLAANRNIYSGPSTLIGGRHPRELCGWRPDENRIADYRQKSGSLLQANPYLLRSVAEQKDVFLWHALLQVFPAWRPYLQELGDCVAAAHSEAVTVLMTIMDLMGQLRFTHQAASESIYGGARVEALGKRFGGWSDGAFGAAASEWLLKWGTLLRVDYSSETNIAEHDLRTYSGDKAKNWGNFGCGGELDKGKLDAVARNFPVRHVASVDTIEEAVASINNGYPITVASMAGYGNMRRDSSGVCRIVGEWAHEMYWIGVRWVDGEPQFRNFQQWGDNVASGPDPGIDNPLISGCSWWVNTKDAEWVLRSGDCWALGDQYGFPEKTLPLSIASSSWYQPDRDPQHILQA